MSLTVLSVAYPFAPVGADSSGGAEQVLCHIERGAAAAGHRSIVVARADSDVRGRLVPIPASTGLIDDEARREVHARCREAIARVLDASSVDLIHMHGIDFHQYLPPAGIPVLVTLHLPPSWYPAEALHPTRPETWFNCVSQSEHLSCPDRVPLVGPVPNGVPLADLRARHAKRRFCLWLGRVCPEKGVHIAIDAAKRAGVPLLVAGNVSAFESHQAYFDLEVRPRLDGRRRYIGPVGLARKRRLLTSARCLLVPSLAPETSSLVSMEALACGTAVIAFPSGAIPEIVEHGRTGFLVSDEDEMAEAIQGVESIDGELCRQTARERFSLERMISGYLDLYRRLAGRRAA